MLRISLPVVAGAGTFFSLVMAAYGADDGGSARYAQPSADAVELATLAPPAPRATADQTYGDAQITRSRFQRRYHRRGPNQIDTEAPFGIVPCEPRAAFAAGYGCKINTRHPGYGQFYAYTPAYVTAPQVPRFVPNVDDSLLPPATTFFLSANRYLFGHSN